MGDTLSQTRTGSVKGGRFTYGTQYKRNAIFVISTRLGRSFILRELFCVTHSRLLTTES